MFKKKSDHFSKTEVNCWFCNEDCLIDHEARESWTCFSCQQYNGFSPDGGYNREIPGQYSVKYDKTETLCEKGHFDTGASVLCPVCSTNLTLKVRQLASFTAISEECYDEELEAFQRYLESIYELCLLCKQRIKETLTKQDKTLRSKMSVEQLKRLADLETNLEEDSGELQDAVQGLRKYVKYIKTPSVPTLCFIVCFVLALSRVLICLRLHVASVVSEGSITSGRMLHQGMLWLVASIPAQSVLNTEGVVYIGASSCVAGLFMCGKYSLYADDAMHLTVWVAVLVTSTNALPWVQHIHAGDRASLAMSSLTACLALTACLRSRHLAGWSECLFQRKHLPPRPLSDEQCDLEQSLQQCTPDQEQEQIDDKESIQRDELTCLQPSLASPPMFEDVRHDLEIFSLGLNKKSSSKSSIWSLPAVVRETYNLSQSTLEQFSDGMTPDSTTGRLTPSKTGRSHRSVLSPSRLGFLSFDSSFCESRSPSHWEPITSASQLSSSGSADDSCSQVTPLSRYDYIIPGRESYPNTSVHGNLPHGNRTEHTGGSPMFTSWRGECLGVGHITSDQQTTERPSSPTCNLFDGSASVNSPTNGSDARDLLYHNILNVGENPHNKQRHDGSTTKNTSNVEDVADLPYHNLTQSPHTKQKLAIRRSQRLAMAGRLLKPWPLRKSFSCNSATDRLNAERAGAASHHHFVAPSVPQLSSDRNSAGDGSNILSTSFNSFTPNESQHHLSDFSRKYSFGNGFMPSAGQNISPAHINSCYSYNSKQPHQGPVLSYRCQTHNRQLYPGERDNLFNFSQSRQPFPGHRNETFNVSQKTQTFSGQRDNPFNTDTSKTEFSDEEEIKVDEVWEKQKSRKIPKNESGKPTGKDVSVRYWVLLGAVIGASLTCNAFMLLHSWLQQ